MTIAYIDDPSLCPMKPVHMIIDDRGFTKVSAGSPNAQVCLNSNPDDFFRLYIPRVIAR